MSSPNVVPVIVGGFLGGYSIARALHQEYGIPSYMISASRTWVLKYTRIARHLHCAAPADPEALLATLTSEPVTGILRSGNKVLLVGTFDASIDAIVAIKDRLPEGIVAPYVGPDLLEAATRKHTFAELAARSGLNLPETLVVDLAEEVDPELEVPFDFPIIGKPTSASAWREADFPGKKKIHRIADRAELVALLRQIRDSGYRHPFVLQDTIPGGDSNMRILTVYADRNSDSRFASFGEVLFEEHAPGVLGNPAAIVSSSAPELVEQAQRFLKDTGWVGYANFDLKYDPRDGKTKFFEINPRLGRSNWYVTGAGNNAPKYYVDEYVEDALGEWDGTVHQQQDETVYHIVPRFLVRRYIKDPARAAQVRRIFRRGGSRNPMLYRAERDPRRWAMIAAVQANYVRKFRRYFDPETDI